MSVVDYRRASAITSRCPSPIIWGDCPTLQIMADSAKGFHIFDDFKNSVIPTEEAGRTALTNGLGNVFGDINWYAYVESALVADLALQADDDGVLMLDTEGTDDDVISITTGNNVCGVCKTPTSGQSTGWWFEARFKVSTVTNTDLGLFVGLAEPGQAKDGYILGAASALADVDYVGFWIQEADGDDLCVVYNEATSGTAQAVHDAATLTADTYVRMGMRYDVNSNKIKCYKDGVYIGTTYDIDVSSTNFPSATDMDLLICVTSGAAGEDADNLKIDWVRFAQTFE